MFPKLLNKVVIPELDIADVVWKIAFISSTKALPIILSTWDSWYKSILFATKVKIGSLFALFIISLYQNSFNELKLNSVVIS